MHTGLPRSALYISLLLTALFLLPPVLSFAQHYHIQTYREQDGVASNTVYNAAQDSLGNLWFGTHNGLTVYNGVEWQRIPATDEATPRGAGLVSIDSNGVVWWVARNLPLRVSRLINGRWEKLPALRVSSGLNSIAAVKSWVDPAGRSLLAVATRRGRLCLWDGESWTVHEVGEPGMLINSLEMEGSSLLISSKDGLFVFDTDSPDGFRRADWDLPDGVVRGVHVEAGTGVLWAVGDRWCARVENRRNVETFPLVELPGHRLDYGVWISASPDGGIYIVEPGGVYYFHPRWGLETITPANGVASDGGYFVLMDREQNTWITSGRGISKIISRRFACYNHRHGLLADEVSSVIHRASGSTVLGHRTGLTFLDSIPRGLTFGNESGVYSRVSDLAEDSLGRLWIAGNRKGLGLLRDDDTIEWTNPDADHASHVFSVLPHPELGLFVGTNLGLYRRVASDFELIDLPRLNGGQARNIRRLVLLTDGRIAIATRESGIYLWKEGQLDHVPGNNEEGSESCYTVFELPDGRIWAGTGRGLYQVGSVKLERTTSPDPIIRRPVYGMILDDEGRVWFGTDDGVMIWDGREITRLTTREGLLGNETNRDALVCDENGHIWIGTDSGVSVYRGEFDIPRDTPPILHLTGLVINGLSSPLDIPLRMEGPLGSVSFHFRAPSFFTDAPLQFKARVAGESDFDDTLPIHWPGTLALTNVPAGDLQLEIQAITADGLESNIIVTPRISVVPPLRDRWYTRVGLVLGGVFSLWLAVAYFSGRRYARRLEVEVRLQTKDLRESEETARRESQRLAGTLESISDGVVVADESRRVILFNKAAGFIFGQAGIPALGCKLVDLVSPEAMVDPEQAAVYREMLAGSGEFRFTSERVPIRLGKGRVGWYEISAVPIGGTPGGTVFAFRDISDRLQVETEERRTQKLESLGLLAGGIAHDFNNLLTIMLGNLSLLEFTLTTTPTERGHLDKIRHASERARNLTHQLLTFAKGGGPVRKSTDLLPIIRESANFSLSGSNVTCRLDLAEDLWWANVDAEQIHQVIGNLTINASQAMPDGGLLEISARNRINRPGVGDRERMVVVDVRDHGSGISPEDQARIFDPYFTTKKQGTGLGLSIAHSIVEKHGGQLTVESTEGIGSTFSLLLPASSSDQSNVSIDRGSQLPVSSPAHKVLVMDDEKEICLVLGSMLRRCGCTCAAAAHGEEALSVFVNSRDQGAPFDLVILDLTIPGGMGGLETLRALRKLDPRVPVVVTSGYYADSVMANYRKFGFSEILGKPFTETDVRKLVKSLMRDDSGE
jgi:PAS domain S-box-containing protein